MPVHDDLGTRMKTFYEQIPKTKLIKIEKELLRVDFTKNIIQTKNYINKKNRLILDDELFLAKQ